MPFDTAPTTSPLWHDWYSTKLRMFHPLKLTPAQERAIEAERTQLHHPLFLDAAPIPVAVLTPAARQDQQQLIRELKGPVFIEDKASTDRPPLLQKYFQDFLADSGVSIDRLLGGKPARTSFGAAARSYKAPVYPSLHYDANSHYTILMRSVALPSEFLRREDKQRHPKLAAAAQGRNARGAIALQKLRDIGALQTARINVLYLMPSGAKNGTLHCSGPIPESPVRGTSSILYSGTFDYYGRAP